MPTVSVCIPTYNYARYLRSAMDSVMAQTWSDFELIVCDNASTDETADVIATYDDDRIRSYRNSRNIGLFANFARCLELARGDFVKFLCSDDWLDPRYLELTVPLMRDNLSVALLTTPGFIVDEQGRRFGMTSAELGNAQTVESSRALEVQARWLNVIGMPTNTLMRRDVAIAVGGFDERFAPASDVHLWLNLLAHGDLGWVPEPLCYLRMHDAKEHEYGSDPTESAFLGWKDAAARPHSVVEPRMLRTALYAEAERSLLYVFAHLAGGRPRQAWRILSMTARHVSWWRVLPRFAVNLPRLLRGQLARVRAGHTGRMVIYGRGTRVGPSLQDRHTPGVAA